MCLSKDHSEIYVEILEDIKRKIISYVDNLSVLIGKSKGMK